MLPLSARLLTVVVLMIAAPVMRAAEPSSRFSCNTKCLSREIVDGWHVYRSENFEIRCRGPIADIDTVTRCCEEARAVMRTTWLSGFPAINWTPVCQVIVHTSASSYKRDTRASSLTKGVTSLQIGEGQVWSRRIDILADSEGWAANLIPHEMTHVVLADRFCHRQIPRWADEGLAILSESGNRVANALETADIKSRSGQAIELAQLLSAASYPSSKEQAELFFAQSAAFSAFLVSQYTEENVMLFVDGCNSIGPAKAAERLAAGQDLDDIERMFQIWLQQRDVEAPRLSERRSARNAKILSDLTALK
jgi:hypothetical protein